MRLSQRGSGTSGSLVLVSLLVFSQVILLMLVVYRILDLIPRVPAVALPVTATSVERISVSDRRNRTVQLPPAKVESDETTDNAP